MNKKRLKILAVIMALVFVSITAFEYSADARMGGGRSFGSRGSRSFSPSKQYSNPSQSRQQAMPGQSQAAPSRQGGGFMRGLAGGVLGGLLGGMLFSSLGFAGFGGLGGSGIGIIEILLLLGLGYFIFKMIKGKRKTENYAYQTSSSYQQPGYPQETYPSHGGGGAQVQEDDVSRGLSDIRMMDARFDESQFKETVMDVFFKVQGAWMNRNISPVEGLMTSELRDIVLADIEGLLKEKKINRLENIAVRKVDIVEAWQESGQDFITAFFTANLLDYTTDESGKVLEGSRTEPVKFEEYWTFTRPVGNGPWKLSAISQK